MACKKRISCHSLKLQRANNVTNNVVSWLSALLKISHNLLKLCNLSLFGSLNCYVYFRVQGLKFQGEDQSDLNDILQRVSAFGLFVYAVFSVIAGSLTAMTSEPNLLVMITGNLSVVQVCNKFINIDAKNNFLTNMLCSWHTSLIIWVLLETFCQIKKVIMIYWRILVCQS